MNSPQPLTWQQKQSAVKARHRSAYAHQDSAGAWSVYILDDKGVASRLSSAGSESEQAVWEDAYSRMPPLTWQEMRDAVLVKYADAVIRSALAQFLVCIGSPFEHVKAAPAPVPEPVEAGDEPLAVTYADADIVRKMGVCIAFAKGFMHEYPHSHREIFEDCLAEGQRLASRLRRIARENPAPPAAAPAPDAVIASAVVRAKMQSASPEPAKPSAALPERPEVRWPASQNDWRVAYDAKGMYFVTEANVYMDAQLALLAEAQRGKQELRDALRTTTAELVAALKREMPPKTA